MQPIVPDEYPYINFLHRKIISVAFHEILVLPNRLSGSDIHIYPWTAHSRSNTLGKFSVMHNIVSYLQLFSYRPTRSENTTFGAFIYIHIWRLVQTEYYPNLTSLRQPGGKDARWCSSSNKSPLVDFILNEGPNTPG